MNANVERSDLIIATEILVNEKLLDGFGHVSLRNPDQLDRFFMVRDNLSGADVDSLVELDLESNACGLDKPKLSLERFIHSEIYRARPDVNAIVHTHSPALIPFGVSKTPLRPLYHMCGFLAAGVPIFDIQNDHGMTNMLIQTRELGLSLTASLGNSAVVLMRGHGATVVGSSLKEAVFRAIYTSINAELQPIAMQLGKPKFLSDEEAVKSDELHRVVLDRAWDFWKSRL